MKKVILILVAGLLLSGSAYAGPMQELLDEKYKITEEKLVEFNDWYSQKIFTLKKGRQVRICTLRISRVEGASNKSKCVTP